MEDKSNDSQTNKRWYLRSYFSVALAILAILNVCLRQSPSDISLEYPIICIPYAVIMMPCIGTLTLAFLSLLLAKDRLAKWICSFAFLSGFLSLGYVLFLAAPLQEAAYSGNLKMAKKLLTLGTNVNVKDSSGKTPLYKAAQKGDAVIVKFLIDKGANINARSAARNTPLITAARHGSVECCELLMQHGASPNVTGYYGSTAYTPLQAAASYGHLDVVKFFLERGIGPDEKEGSMTALLHACENGHSEVVETLLAAGANINSPVRDRREKTLLGLAKKSGNKKIIKMLMERGAQTINSKER